MERGTDTRPRVGRNFLKLGAGEAVARIIAFGATVYVARALGASAYGVIALATAILLYLSVLSDAGIDTLGIQQVAANRAALFKTLPDILGARLLIGIGLILVTVVVGLAVLPQPEGAVLAVYALILVTVGMGTRWVHLGLEQTGRASVARLVSEGVSAFLIVAVVRTPADLARVPLAQLVGESLGALLLLHLLPTGSTRLRVRLRPAMVPALLFRSWPMVVHALLGLAIFNSDFIFLRILRDSAAVGFYAAGYTLVSFFLNLATAYTSSMIPALTRLRSDRVGAGILYSGSMAQVVTVALPVCVGGALVANEVVTLVFGSAYAPSTTPLRILLLLLPLAGIRAVSQGALLAYERQGDMLRASVWAAAVNLLLNVALIPRWGMAGAAWATVLTEGLRTTLSLGFTHNLKIPGTSPRRFLPGLTASGLMAGVVLSVKGMPVLITILLGATVFLGCLAALGGVRLRRGGVPELTV